MELPEVPQNFIRAWRQRRRLTQAELAKLVGTSAQTISRFESGNRGISAKKLAKLAEVLDCSEADLLHEAPQQASRVRLAARQTDALERIASALEEMAKKSRGR